MASKKKLLQAAAGSAGGAGLDVDEVFSTYLYDGNSSTQAINNGIDLDGEGGLVWIKRRDGTLSHALFDTARGAGALLQSNLTAGHYTGGDDLTAFNSNGFTLGDGQFTSINYSSYDYVSWTFRKAEKFFDVLTYTGNGVAGRTVSHNLGSVPGMMIVKKTNASTAWTIYHRSLGATKYLLFDTSDAGTQTARWNDTEPTSTQFTVGTSGGTNDNGDTYVAYLFAHNNSDGEFGPDGDADIIKCGSYTGNAGNPQVIDVGFEPQLLMVKCTSDTGDWFVVDNMRGVLPDGGYPCNNLYWNKTDAETLSGTFGFFANGFTAGQSSSTNGSGRTFIYMAIRRGPLAAPDDATKVFAVDAFNSSDPRFTSGFPVDMAIATGTSSTSHNEVQTRLLGNSILKTSSTSSETPNQSHIAFDYQTGHNETTYWNNTGAYSWMWKRAPSYFDVVGYVGAGAAQTVNHNLGVVPEMMWIKNRDSAENWAVYHSALGTSKYLHLNTTDAALTTDAANRWNNTSPTATQFTVGTSTEVSHFTRGFIAYLFATVAGVSKVGSYTGTGSSGNDVDCGFTSGARFVLIRNVNGDEWVVFDTARGITSANNDPKLSLNGTGAENSSSSRDLDPLSSGFTVNGADTSMNASGDTYIFYAIA